MEDDMPLFRAVKKGNISAVEAALEAGANLNGHPDQPYAPIVVAIIYGSEGVVNYILKHGADPDKPVTVGVLLPSGVNVTPILGARALHMAILAEKLEIVSLLLKCYRADPNATDNKGTTALMTACLMPCVSVGVVGLLLEAGADPTLADDKGMIPLHIAAQSDMPDLIDMLHSAAPATLDRCTSNGMTALYMARNLGQERMVSKLLSLGAIQPGPSQKPDVCPLVTAVSNGFVGVVRVLLAEGGKKAVGGKTALHTAFVLAIIRRRANMFRLLLNADGVKGRLELANSSIECKSLLHSGASLCYPPAVSTLLEAGADELAHGSTGHIARDVVGCGLFPGVRVYSGDAGAIRRMLQRGPAYRARSWAWPSDEEVGASGARDATDGGKGVAVGAAAARSEALPHDCHRAER